MVHVNSPGGTISLTNAMRTHTGMDQYNKNTNAELSNYLVLTVNGNNFSDQAFVYFTNEATRNFDGDFDAHKLMSMNPAVPAIYTITPDSTKLAINSLPLAAASTPLPLAFIPGTDGAYTITASELTTFQTDAIILLEDRKSGTFQDLMKIPCTLSMDQPRIRQTASSCILLVSMVLQIRKKSARLIFIP